MFVDDFSYRFICGSLIIAKFLAVEKGVCLYAGGLICKYCICDKRVCTDGRVLDEIRERVLDVGVGN